MQTKPNCKVIVGGFATLDPQKGGGFVVTIYAAADSGKPRQVESRPFTRKSDARSWREANAPGLVRSARSM